MKICGKCQCEKNETEFHKNVRSKDGLHSICKICNNAKVNEWRLANLERSRENARRYQKENREERKQYLKQYYADNRERLIETNTEYNKNNPEQRKETQKRYRYNKISDREFFIRALVRTARTNAKIKKLDFELNHVVVNTLIILQNEKCCVTGINFDYNHSPEFRARPFGPSIDRKDNSKGYTYDNIQIVCVIVNKAKNEYPQEFFDNMCAARMRFLNGSEI